MSAPRGEAARARIIEAAQQTLLDGGLAAFTVEGVANASGAARSTIYRHWPDADDLLLDALRRMGGEFPLPDTGSLRGDLLAGIARMHPILADPRARRLLLDITRAAVDDPEIERIRQRLIAERQQPTRIVLQRAIARGEIAADIDMDMALHLVEGPIMSVVVLEGEPVAATSLEPMVERIIRSLT